MAEYIEREAALSVVNLFDRAIALAAGRRITNLPAADVAPVRHSRWEEAADGDGVVCSSCGTDFCTMIHDTEHFNYCPNCGAKMDL